MTLIVNKDTYITLEEANTYLSQHYVSTDPLLIQWNSLSDNDKEVFLRRAFDQKILNNYYLFQDTILIVTIT